MRPIFFSLSALPYQVQHSLRHVCKGKLKENIKGGITIPDGDPYCGNISRGFVCSDDKTSSYPSEAVAGCYCGGRNDAFPLPIHAAAFFLRVRRSLVHWTYKLGSWGNSVGHVRMYILVRQ